MTTPDALLESVKMAGPVPIAARQALSFRYHFEALEKGRLVSRFCQSCAEYTFPPADYCQHCNEKGTQWRDMSRFGRLYSKTSMSFTPEVFHPYTPVTVGVIDLDANVRLLAWLVEPSLSLDSELELVVIRFDNGVLLGARAR